MNSRWLIGSFAIHLLALAVFLSVPLGRHLERPEPSVMPVRLLRGIQQERHPPRPKEITPSVQPADKAPRTLPVPPGKPVRRTPPRPETTETEVPPPVPVTPPAVPSDRVRVPPDTTAPPRDEVGPRIPAREGPPGSPEGGAETVPGRAPGATPPAPGTPLWDSKVVDRIARPRVPAPPEMTFHTGGLKYTTYLYRLKDQIQSVWRYPEREGRLGIEGDLLIRFEILDDGNLGPVELVRTSGFPNLDEAALSAVRDAAPFYPLPKTWELKSFTITGRFIYRSGRSYIR